MTRHLRDGEFVDFAEGTLAAPCAAHLDTCSRCREQAEAVAAALREAAAVEIPEPSPLFWKHFSARVREHIAQETPERAAWWGSVSVRALVPLVATLAVIVAIVSAMVVPRLMTPRTPPATAELASSHSTTDATLAADDDLPSSVDDRNAEVWAVLTAAASDMGVEDARAAGMVTHPGAVDHEVTHLSQAELTELGRLLQSQLKESGH